MGLKVFVRLIHVWRRWRLKYSKSNSHLFAIRTRVENEQNALLFQCQQVDPDVIFNLIEASDEFLSARVIAVYQSVGNEVNTHKFIEKWKGTKRIIIPAVVDGEMYLLPFERDASDKTIFKRKAQKEIEKIIDIFIVPGFAFDKNKNRIGFGGSFYDRYLKSGKFIKWGICYSYQLFDRFPQEVTWGCKVDRVFSDKCLVN